MTIDPINYRTAKDFTRAVMSRFLDYLVARNRITKTQEAKLRKTYVAEEMPIHPGGKVKS